MKTVAGPPPPPPAIALVLLAAPAPARPEAWAVAKTAASQARPGIQGHAASQVVKRLRIFLGNSALLEITPRVHLLGSMFFSPDVASIIGETIKSDTKTHPQLGQP